MAWTSTRLAVLGAFLLASIVSVIAVGQRELSKNKAQTGEISVAVYPDQSILVPAGYRFQNRQVAQVDAKTSLAFEQKKPSVTHGFEPRFVRL